MLLLLSRGGFKQKMENVVEKTLGPQFQMTQAWIKLLKK